MLYCIMFANGYIFRTKQYLKFDRDGYAFVPSEVEGTSNLHVEGYLNINTVGNNQLIYCNNFSCNRQDIIAHWQE